MPEKCKLKYLKICENEDLVYEIIDMLNIFLNRNPFATKKEKLEKIELIKNKDFKLYQAMIEDINAGLY